MTNSIKLLKLRLHPDPSMILLGTTPDRFIWLSVVSCQLNLFYSIRKTKSFLSLENSTRTKSFGVTSIGWFVLEDSAI
jgi:hypothetical protein